MYGIGIEREHKEDYVLPMNDLKTIDEVFLTRTKEEILEILKQNDSVITETNPELLKIEKYMHGKWRDLHIDMIDNPMILIFSFEELFHNHKEEKILHILFNHFSAYLKKDYVSTEFKEVILAMQENKTNFLEKLKYLSYDEEREIRVYLNKKIDITNKKIEPLVNENTYCLQRKVEDKVK